MALTASKDRRPLARPPTIACLWETVSGRPIADELLEWPPDLFALTSLILERSEAYRFGLTPFGAEQLQGRHRAPGWADAVEKAARQWCVLVESGERAVPDVVAAAWRVLRERAEEPLEQLAEGNALPVCEALFTLHAVADEACAGLGVALDASGTSGLRYRPRGRELLARTGSLARIPSSALRILPKERTPSGTSSRSLARYACAVGPEVGVEWIKLPCRRGGTGIWSDVVSVLLLPWPLRVRESDFRPLQESVQRLAKEPYGLFEFRPAEGLDLDLVERMIVTAQEEVESVDVVLLPESALDEDDIPGLEALLDRLGVVCLISGVRQRSREPGRLPGNWVHTGMNPRLVKGGPRALPADTGWFHVRQNKHHRWSLDERQINQYHLGGALHPRVRWWEATEVPRRMVQVMEVGEGLTIIGVVCEDLAQIDQVADVVRSVGPSFVYTPLLDGPQLGSRWAARYASVLADDPGSAILTLTSFGMAQRSRPGGRAPSPVVGLWKDPVRGARELALEGGAEGILVTLCTEQTMRRSADGRWPVENSPLLYFASVHQIRSPRAAPGPREPRPVPPPRRPPLGVQELSVLTTWSEAVAEVLAYAPERVAATLSDAVAGAPWRAPLGLDEPSPRLAEAIECVSRTVRAATAGGRPSLEAVHAAVCDDRQGEPDLDALVRRVLRTTVGARWSRTDLERGPAST